MASYSYVQDLVSMLEKDNNLQNTDLWLAHEVLYLLKKYPELQNYIDKNLSNMSLSEILMAFFQLLVAKKKIKRPNYRGLPFNKLKKLRISHYLIAGFMINSALRYCFNHRYNITRHVEWEIDYTEAKNTISKNLAHQDVFSQNSTRSGKTSNRTKLKRH